MPGFDGTGPQGRGPMTGRGRGFCVLQESKDNLGQIKGLAGIQGMPIHTVNKNPSEEREVITMPRGDGTGPAGLGPMTGRAAGFCADYPVPGYMNPAVGRFGYYKPAGYGLPYTGWFNPWLSRGFSFGRGFGFRRGFSRGRGRGRRGFGYWY